MSCSSKINVLVTPAGSGMAIVAIKALLRDPSINVVAADMNPLAAGLFLANKGYIVPPIDNEEEFFHKISSLVTKERVHVIIPCLDTFLLPFSLRKQEFMKKHGVAIIVSPPETIRVCRDKWLLYENLNGIVPMPRTILACANGSGNADEVVREVKERLGFPVVIKPRHGSGSKNVFVVNDEDELRVLIRRVPKPMVQEYVRGDEYTIDMLVDQSHKPVVIVPRKRIETKAGISVKGVVEMRRELVELAQRVCGTLRFYGPINVQVIVDRENGVPKLTEVNPRIAGGMSLSVAAGVNIPLLSVYMALGKKIEIAKPREGVFMTRFFEEVFVSAEQLEKSLGRV